MSVTPIESASFGSYLGIQSAWGTAATDALFQLRQVTGALSTNDDEGEELHGGDSRRAATPFLYKNLIQGQGTPGYQGTPRAIHAFSSIILGSDVVVAPGVGETLYQHTAEDDENVVPFGLWQTNGTDANAIKRKFNDCRMTQLEISAGAANKVARVTPTIVSLDPDEVYSVDPTVTLADAEYDEPYLYTDLTGSISVDGQTYHEVSQITVRITDTASAWQGDDVRALTFLPGRLRVEAALTVLLTTDTLELLNKSLYGKHPVVNGDKPSNTVHRGGTFSFKFERTDDADEVLDSVEFEIDNAAFRTGAAIEGSAEGGGIELPLRIVSTPASERALRVITYNLDEDPYVTP